MAVNNLQFPIDIIKNNNSSSPGYGKFYGFAHNAETLSTEGLVDHITKHNCAVGKEAIAAVIKKLSECVPELVAQGQPVKIDGLGIFYGTVSNRKNGIMKDQLLDNKVNPLSSCLPMLVQIPVFIALFTVLRSAVELRYAPFLWISDLSEPEALFSSWFPFGGLNILPLAMAGLTMLQSAFTPSGDNSQQRMMMIMMPLMMLFMFYNFPSALSLYWALSTAFGVAQAWWIKKRYGAPAARKSADGVIEPDSVEMPQTRQMRRHGGQ